MAPAIPVANMIGRLAATPWAYILLWVGSLAVSVALIVILRTRWGQSRPLHKCAVLSLLVHLVLAWGAMTVRFVAGDGSSGSGPPIRVRVVTDGMGPLAMGDVPVMSSAEESPKDMAPPLLPPPQEEVEGPAPKREEPTVPEPADERVETKPEPTAPASEAIAELSVPDEAAAPTELKNDEPDLAAAAEARVADRPPPTDAASEATSEQALPVVGPSLPAVAAPYSLRNSPGRLGLVEREGGSAQTEAAVQAALRWLAAAQSRDGRWAANDFGAGQEYAVLGHNRGGAGRDADTGISALALLTFLGAGYSHVQGDYQDTVRSGLDSLLRSQAADGSIFGNATLYAQMYCHSMATFALAEAQAMTGDRRLEPAVQKAIDYCLMSQNTSTGGWRYRPGDSGDTSQLGWQMMALTSAERAGINVPSHTWTRVERFLRSVRRGQHGGFASYRPDSGPSTSMTAEALYCRMLLNQASGVQLDEASTTEAVSALLIALPEKKRVNLYYWYYATLALYHRHNDSDRAGEDWRIWNDALTTTLLATQVRDGADAGSWGTNCIWGGYGGRVYTTAMAAMCLEVYYRYAPLQSSPPGQWMAAQPEAASSPH